MNRFLFVLAFATGCASAAKSPLQTYSPREPKNYIIVHEGRPVDFARATCFRIDVAEETGRVSAGQLLARALEHFAPGLPPCRGGEPFLLGIEYHAGKGVCIDCGTSSKEPQSGFAFISVLDSSGKEYGSAEWQYWRGGSAEDMASAFVFDLVNLWIAGVQKPPV